MANAIRTNKLQQLDTLLFCKFHARVRTPMKHISVWLSRTGDGYLYLLIGLALYWLVPTVGKAFFMTALLAYAFEVPIYITLKKLVRRDRPFDKLTGFSSHIAPSDKFSMPSGHTAAAFVFATLVAAFFPSYALFAYSWATLIGMSRVILGVHFPGDIIAGALLGVACAELSLSLMS